MTDPKCPSYHPIVGRCGGSAGHDGPHRARPIFLGLEETAWTAEDLERLKAVIEERNAADRAQAEQPLSREALVFGRRVRVEVIDQSTGAGQPFARVSLSIDEQVVLDRASPSVAREIVDALAWAIDHATRRAAENKES